MRKETLTALYQEFWRKAYTSPVPLTIRCKDTSEAHTLRFALYQACRDVRRDPSLDPFLHEALQVCGISFHPTDRRVLLLGKKVVPEGAAELARQLGISIEALTPAKTAEDAEIAASLARVTQGLGTAASDTATAIPPTANKYYTREEN